MSKVPDQREIEEFFRGAVDFYSQAIADAPLDPQEAAGFAIWRAIFLELSEPDRKVAFSDSPEATRNVIFACLAAAPEVLISGGFLGERQLADLGPTADGKAIGAAVNAIYLRWAEWSRGWLEAGGSRGELLRAVFRVLVVPRPAARDGAVVAAAARERSGLTLSPREKVGEVTDEELLSIVAVKALGRKTLDGLISCRKDGSWVLDKLTVRDILRSGSAQHKPVASATLEEGRFEPSIVEDLGAMMDLRVHRENVQDLRELAKRKGPGYEAAVYRWREGGSRASAAAKFGTTCKAIRVAEPWLEEELRRRGA